MRNGDNIDWQAVRNHVREMIPSIESRLIEIGKPLGVEYRFVKRPGSDQYSPAFLTVALYYPHTKDTRAVEIGNYGAINSTLSEKEQDTLGTVAAQVIPDDWQCRVEGRDIGIIRYKCGPSSKKMEKEFSL